MPATSVDPELRRIIKRGAKLIPLVQDLVEQSTNSDEATGELAHRIGAVASEYLAMRKVLWQRRGEPLADEVESLLNFHQQILEQASNLAFRPRGERWADVAAHFGSGESESSHKLERLAAEC
jgi:hypothetical protein